MTNESEIRPAIRSIFILIGWICVLIGMTYTICGLIGLVPLELEGRTVTNIRIPAGVAVVGCLICAFAYGED